MAEPHLKPGLGRADYELVAGFDEMRYCLKLNRAQDHCSDQCSEHHSEAVIDSSVAEEGGMGAQQPGLLGSEGQVVGGSLKLVSVELAVDFRRSGIWTKVLLEAAS